MDGFMSWHAVRRWNVFVLTCYLPRRGQDVTTGWLVSPTLCVFLLAWVSCTNRCEKQSRAVRPRLQSHLDEGFSPESGANSQESAGSSPQPPNVTLQLPALDSRARLWRNRATVKHTAGVEFGMMCYPVFEVPRQNDCSFSSRNHKM